MQKQEMEEVIEILIKQKHLYKNTALMEVQQHYKTPFHVLISCVLSLRTKDTTTGPAGERLFKLAQTPEAMVKVDVKKIEKAIYPVGFYLTKAKNIKILCQQLIDNHKGEVPKTIEELLQLKNVGRKTAAITMVYGHGIHEHIPSDTHVHKCVNRLEWVKTKNPDDTEDELKKIIPKKYWRDLNDLLVQFGQNICLSVSPWCSKCPIKKHCPKKGVKKSR
jgi:endonuclease-3